VRVGGDLFSSFLIPHRPPSPSISLHIDHRSCKLCSIRKRESEALADLRPLPTETPSEVRPSPSKPLIGLDADGSLAHSFYFMPTDQPGCVDEGPSEVCMLNIQLIGHGQGGQHGNFLRGSFF